jgi:fatty-acyl-CoA synthase
MRIRLSSASFGRFACDNLAALWNLHHPFVYNNESADTTIKNLGAYVRHVRVRDSEQAGDAYIPCLIGEGIVPMTEMAAALRSIDYSGYLSMEYKTDDSGLNDPDIVLPHYVNVISRFIRIRSAASYITRTSEDGNSSGRRMI